MKKEVTYVIGHKNPDTDSICSAIALAELKRTEGFNNIKPARAGDVNPQTMFVLNRFNIEPPKYLSNVYPRASDIMSIDVASVSQSTPLLRVMEIMRDKNIRIVPVVDKERRPKGILTLMDLARRNLDQVSAENSRAVFTSVANIVETLQADLVVDHHGAAEMFFSVYVGAMEEASFLKVIDTNSEPEACAVIVGDREGIQKASVEKGIGLLVITGGLKVDERVAQAAKKRGTSIIRSPFDSAATALLIRLSTPACNICNSDFEKTSPDELAEDLKHKMANSSQRGIIVLDNDGVMAGIITKSNLLRKSGTSLILVDHNELSQAVDGADMVTISEVVDHHRLGNFHTTQPISFICEPVGSTSTLVARMYRQHGVAIKKEIAGLLLAGVMSDTVILRSPTTTGIDRDIVPWLEEKSSLDHKKFGQEIFAATSSLQKRGAKAVVEGDYKTFEARGKKFGIGQVETIGFDEFYEEKEKLIGELVKVSEKKGLKLSALLITDIVYGTSLLLAVGEKEVLFRFDYPLLEEHVYELKNVLSRKKQVVPHLINLFNEIY